MLINSPKSAQLAALASRAAQRCGAPQYSVLTGSLSMEHTVDTLLARDRASVCNLREFAAISEHLGVKGCPSDEETAEPERVAKAMLEVAKRQTTGHLIVTLGRRGCLVLERSSRSVRHVHLKPRFYSLVQNLVRQRPRGVNAAGDRFFMGLVLALEMLPAGNGHVTKAAVHASVEAVRRFAPELDPDSSWFAVTRPSRSPQR
jgi:hypothetical protein